MPKAPANGSWWNRDIHGKIVKRKSGQERYEILKDAAQESGFRGAVGKYAVYVLNETRTGKAVKKLSGLKD